MGLVLLDSTHNFTPGDLVTGGYLFCQPAAQTFWFADGRTYANGCFHKLNFNNDKLVGTPTGTFQRGETVIQAVSGAAGIFDESISTRNYVYRTTTEAFDTTNLITGQTSGATLTPTSVGYPPHWEEWTTRLLSSPATGTGTIANTDNYLPVGGSNIGCLFNGRIFLNSLQNPNQWVASRRGDPQDFQPSQSDDETPVSSQNAQHLLVGNPICAMVPFLDHYLYFGCLDEIWILRGDPSNGTLTNSSRSVGFFGPDAWTFDNLGNLFFMGMDGFYMFQRGSGVDNTPPINLTNTRLPNLVKSLGLNRRTDKVEMAYDKDRYGINVNITQYDGTFGTSFFWDLRMNALLPESFGNSDHYPASMFYYNSRNPNNRGMLMGCQDGHIRKFDDTAKNDDGSQAIDAYCTLGPFQAFNKQSRQGKLAELLVRLGEDSDGVDVHVYAGNSAETVINNIKNAATPNDSITMTGGGRKPTYRPRGKGSVFAVQLRNNTAGERFAIEQVTAKIRDAGSNKGV